MANQQIVTVQEDLYRLDFFDFSAHYERLDQRGYQGGGYSWQGVVDALLHMQEPALLRRIRLDAEVDCLVVWAEERSPLEKVSEVLTLARGDDSVFEAAVLKAEELGVME